MSERKNLRDRYARLSEYTNANLFISNNANPFLISPYTPINPGQFTKVTITQEIQEQLSSIISSFSSIINITDYSIRLSTIYPATATSTVRVDGSFVVDDDLTVDGALNFTTLNGSSIIADTANISSVFFSTLTGSSIVGETANISSVFFSTLNGSSIVGGTANISSVFFSTLTGSSIIADTANISSVFFSTLNGSSIVADTANISSVFFSTLNGSSIVADTANISSIYYSTLTGSTISTNYMTVNNNLVVSSIQTASSITTLDLIFSSISSSTALVPVPSSSTIQGSIRINVGGTLYRIALYTDS